MAVGSKIFTYFKGSWQPGNVPVMGSADHGTWLGTLVFDGARSFEGLAPDLDLHCARLNASAVTMGLKPTMRVPAMVELARDGLRHFDKDAAVYIRPMYWSTEGGRGVVIADPESTVFCLCLEELPMPPDGKGMTVTTTRYCRPLNSMQLVEAKAACLYPNNGRMLREAQSKGFDNAVVRDIMGNVAETATANIFIAKKGEVLTPIPNGTFLNGITRQRIIGLLRQAGVSVHETVLSLDDVRGADEVFTSGNIAKVTPVLRFDDRDYAYGPLARQARSLYWAWAHAG
jgi:branched-chain amino acid aminotransferase